MPRKAATIATRNEIFMLVWSNVKDVYDLDVIEEVGNLILDKIATLPSQKGIVELIIGKKEETEKEEEAPKKKATKKAPSKPKKAKPAPEPEPEEEDEEEEETEDDDDLDDF